MLNVAVVGLGNMGKHHARVYKELGANLVAVADVSEPAKALAASLGCKFYADYKTMLDREKIDALSIVVPTLLHKEIAVEALSRGIATLVEKPIAKDVSEAKQIVRAARKEGALLTVGHIERFNPAVQKLKEKLSTLGEITSMSARRVGFASQARETDVITDLAIHDIDVFNYLLEKCPAKAYAVAGKILDSKKEDYAFVTLNYGTAIANCQVNRITPIKIRELYVTGTKGYAELDYITQRLVFYETIVKKEYNSFGEFVLKFGAPAEKEVKVEKQEPLRLELKHFLDCAGGKSKPLVTAEEAVSALSVVEAALKSCKEAGEQKVLYENL